MKILNLVKNGVHYFAINKSFQGLTAGTVLGSMATMIWVYKNQCSCSPNCLCSTNTCNGFCPLSTGFYKKSNNPQHLTSFCFYKSLGCCSCKEDDDECNTTKEEEMVEMIQIVTE